MGGEGKHRGPAPKDRALFDDATLPSLRAAVQELSWLLDRGYPEPSALKLVGDHHQLTSRQRTAVRRAACTDAQRHHRHEAVLGVDQLVGRPLAIDGFNALILCETLFSQGLVVVGRDGALRDLASVHGTWKRVSETREALGALADVVVHLGARPVVWYLDRPVSNSGRLRAMIEEEAAWHHTEWEVRLVDDADRQLASFDGVVATGDAWILDRADAWVDLPAAVWTRRGGGWVVPLA